MCGIKHGHVLEHVPQGRVLLAKPSPLIVVDLTREDVVEEKLMAPRQLNLMCQHAADDGGNVGTRACRPQRQGKLRVLPPLDHCSNMHDALRRQLPKHGLHCLLDGGLDSRGRWHR